ncbi:BolA/IbaG family iron-sulfur metabolism protein [Ursidibacter maritimus]|uniref:DNA-binding transcriptional regulator BolA n=1 Tax=Ursidibacter maritimus TaxID=1331689 RepID=A0A949T2T8_9PAST|nr:BolA/IbaG family iron-sulfur metabolism protein [Ursidibacter maritimus]KAE9540470.1 transcriptional regulator [Ursidibacter maritimus]MBV6523560.1 BolA/IbaG family iron-sulfur metabolism protein [Ursidibacter maritimus]MBV6525060.1 BolA/IbaG family iron-sulfur metabolism protein [Ursidibacter maritimus]MBV6527262.1 BolA/IbaG family iron-sulfur metabolism protein [Ursidibacter maritimus]MBV6528674.1 BolA/IbaG family iron-sulfur metabolism protein [Ursidibacter maritimus]
MSVQQTIIQKLTEQFTPSMLQVENESHRHSSGRGAESHFKVTIVSAEFEQMRTLARHRNVYQCLADELANGVHALALHTYTQQEWLEQDEVAPKSTNCVGHGH